jgi:hypothetical protein
MTSSTGYKTVTICEVSASVSIQVESASPRPIKAYVSFTMKWDLFSSQNGHVLRIPDRQHNRARKCTTETGVQMCSKRNIRIFKEYPFVSTSLPYINIYLLWIQISHSKSSRPTDIS